MAPRKTPEWIGKTPDTKVPPRVKTRVYDRFKGVCHICKVSIKPGETWHADHVQALIEDGENREGNLKPAHAHCNLAKADEEKARKSKVARTRKKHLGITSPKQAIKSRGFEPGKQRSPKTTLPPKPFYERAE